jgi:hypothetical protein
MTVLGGNLMAMYIVFVIVNGKFHQSYVPQLSYIDNQVFPNIEARYCFDTEM